MSTLDLSGSNVNAAGGFDLMKSGPQPAVVWEVEHTETDNEEGNLPVGTPGWIVTIKIQGGDYDNRNLWDRFYIPPAEYDEKKAAFMKDRLATFLHAIGYSEKEITSGKFKIDADAWVGREFTVIVGRTKADPDKGYEARNKVSGYKTRSAGDASGTDSDDLL